MLLADAIDQDTRTISAFGLSTMFIVRQPLVDSREQRMERYLHRERKAGIRPASQDIADIKPDNADACH